MDVTQRKQKARSIPYHLQDDAKTDYVIPDAWKDRKLLNQDCFVVITVKRTTLSKLQLTPQKLNESCLQKRSRMSKF